VVLFVGDDFGRKGLERAIRAIAKTQSNAELWVAGRDDPQRFEELAVTLNVQDRIRFLGRVDADRVPEIYSGCDVLVLPSRQDAWGLPVIEAMAATRVVLASEFTGAHVVIRDGINGFVLEREGSPEQIAAILDGPAADSEVRSAIGERACQTVASFDRTVMYERLRDAHRKALDRRLSQKHQLDE
jgi:glycosyltransferase involved in cell wall biosynthesis